MKTVACPRCGKKAPFSPKNKWRPFCSERCKIVDLGKWAAEDYRVKTGEAPADDDPNSKTPGS